jgi:hypothetical protein
MFGCGHFERAPDAVDDRHAGGRFEVFGKRDQRIEYVRGRSVAGRPSSGSHSAQRAVANSDRRHCYRCLASVTSDDRTAPQIRSHAEALKREKRVAKITILELGAWRGEQRPNSSVRKGS